MPRPAPSPRSAVRGFFLLTTTQTIHTTQGCTSCFRCRVLLFRRQHRQPIQRKVVQVVPVVVLIILTTTQTTDTTQGCTSCSRCRSYYFDDNTDNRYNSKVVQVVPVVVSYYFDDNTDNQNNKASCSSCSRCRVLLFRRQHRQQGQPKQQNRLFFIITE